ncbi:ribbon-helix-helix domain-containing protein [Gehongia tenuis]|uniref:CopG family transcriptional regulator n=1 Tax=Gehongia tenuis TaxID=2763655 RepID=A0A926D323_9FIRM|nr:ribbon-helix-helix domain-containing protein [Gehongia tenuis]MBC8530626.1 CopG family transcriptional regulator [Gehongia tenuis]
MKNFIPKAYKKEPITIRICCEKVELIDHLAYQCDISRSEFINQCIDYALENMPPSGGK